MRFFKTFPVTVVIVFLCFSVLSTPTAQAASDDVKTDISFAIKNLQGDNTYKIWGFDPSQLSWQSELEFELNTYIAEIKGEMTFADLIAVGLSYGAAVTDSSSQDSTLKDSDWFWQPYVPQTAIYSMSDLDSDVQLYDIYLKYMFFPLTDIDRMEYSTRFFVKIGYKKQHFDYTASNGIQTDITGGVYPFEGKALDYQIDYSIPYIGAGFMFSPIETLDLFIGFDYSNWVTSSDKDDHLLRSKMSESDGSDGWFVNAMVNADWWFKPCWALFLNFEYSKIDVDGKQSQYFYAGENEGLTYENIPYNVESQQTYIGGGIKFRF